MLRNRLVNLPRQLPPPLVTRLHPQLHARRTIADHQLPQALRSTDRPHTPQHAAPALAQQIILRDPEVGEQVLEFGHEELWCPESRVEAFFAQMCAVAVAELVVEDHGDGVLFCQLGEGEEVVVAGAGPAVESDQGPCGGGQVADDFVPGVAWFVCWEGGVVEGNRAFFDGEG